MSGPQAAQETLADAIASEQEIADEAAKIRGEAKELTPELFMQLRPLLRKPIPSVFIKNVGVVKGKPYESTGVSSMQVQVERMDNVLTPMWWRERPEHSDGGTLCRIVIEVGSPAAPLFTRESYGGVDRGSSLGNVYKGSRTNAGKLALALVGPGHEVYYGGADLDPDVNQEIAKQDAPSGQPAKTADIGPGIAAKLVDRIWGLPDAKGKLQLAASHVAGRDVGDCSTEKGAKEGLAGLTFEQAERLDTWISKKETEADVDSGESDA